MYFCYILLLLKVLNRNPTIPAASNQFEKKKRNKSLERWKAKKGAKMQKSKEDHTQVAGERETRTSGFTFAFGSKGRGASSKSILQELR
jgi:hypothetical protein